MLQPRRDGWADLREASRGGEARRSAEGDRQAAEPLAGENQAGPRGDLSGEACDAVVSAQNTTNVSVTLIAVPDIRTWEYIPLNAAGLTPE